MTFWTILALILSMLALFYAWTLQQKIMVEDEGNDTMQRIARQIQAGAMAFLKTEYKWLSLFVIVVAAVMSAVPALGWRTAIAFICGAFASGLAGWIGMHTATRAAVRTTQAARSGLSKALDIAFSSGTVMGLCVVGLGLGGITILSIIYGRTAADLESVLGFSFGASSIALFARVGGGIFTKAADVGADLVGKVEAGIPEDDPRNPAVIADNVGDNVGDVAGMGADLFESYVGSILATMIMGAVIHSGELQPFTHGTYSHLLVIYPIVLASLGIVASVAGTLLVTTNDEKKLGQALHNGLLGASGVLIVLMAIATLLVGPAIYSKGLNGPELLYGPWDIFLSMLIGLMVGVLIGNVTEYYTSEKKAPVQEIARQSQTGSATNIIHGLATGMGSTWLPIILIAVGIFFAHQLAGVYGISLAAVGMLSTLGISLGIDAFGPVADNAGGLAEMASLDPEVRQRTDALDATGNTTAAIGKGFAIGSAALTALALFNTYGAKAQVEAAAVGGSFNLDVSNPTVMIGLFIGGMLPFFFSSMAMKAVGSAANKMIEEVRRQFRDIKGLLEGEAEPEAAKCVEIATAGSIRQMVAPGMLAVLAPIAMGLLLGMSAVGGLLVGALISGVMMALFMANAGGAWDNAKKFIESGELGGKGSEPHKAAIVGDTVGDPFKDTAGPAINILIKLMTIVALVFLPLFASPLLG
ncbi:MAG: sodium-translocating pyrophosphatase [Planctomycetota bacterium]|nr:MAG: sodium-translocating pyrophosphatase [Planctomycetota bacterium]